MTIATLFVPDLYAPSILRKRAKRLSSETGRIYLSHFDAAKKPVSPAQEAKKYFLDPFKYLLKEPIALLLSTYIAFLYGIL